MSAAEGRLPFVGHVGAAPPRRSCLTCGASLAGRRPQAKFCSDRCRSVAHRAERIAAHLLSETRTCPECGTPIPGLRLDATYCGTSCRVRAWKRRDARDHTRGSAENRSSRSAVDREAV